MFEASAFPPADIRSAHFTALRRAHTDSLPRVAAAVINDAVKRYREEPLSKSHRILTESKIESSYPSLLGLINPTVGIKTLARASEIAGHSRNMKSNQKRLPSRAPNCLFQPGLDDTNTTPT